MRLAHLLCPLMCIVAPTLAAAKTPAEMEPLTWMSIPDSKMRSVQADPELYADLQGNGFPNIMLAWGGGILDTQRLRLVIWGGGHNDYYGNEMYAFDIETLTWERLTEPTVDWNNCGDPNADGTANGRHTYRSLAYVEHADRMFVSGGSLNCYSGSCGGQITWAFDFDALSWDNRQPSGNHSTQCENIAEYDPNSQRVYFGDPGGLYAFDYDANTWTQLNDEYLYAHAVAIDTSRNELLMLGDGEVWSYDIGGGNFARETWATTGGDAFIAGTAQGLDYDPTTDRYVGWGGDTVYALDPESREWTTYDVPGAPPTIDGLRVWGRWRYVPGVNAFILATDVDTDVHFFKFSEGGEIPESGDSGDESDGGPADSGGSDDAADSATSVGGGGSDSNDAGDGSATGGDTGGAGDDAAGGSTGGAAAADGASDDAGCGCRATTSDSGWLALVLLGGLRRRRRARQTSSPSRTGR